MSRLIRFSELLLIGGSGVKRGPIMAQTCVIQIETDEICQLYHQCCVVEPQMSLDQALPQVLEMEVDKILLLILKIILYLIDLM